MATEHEYAGRAGVEPPRVFSLGVVAPPGFSPPPHQVRARLAGLLVRKRERVAFRCVFGEPVSKACLDLARERDWLHAMHGPPQGKPVREWLGVLVGSDAVAVVYAGGPLPPDLWELVRVAHWCGVPVRTVVIGPEAAPL